MPITTGAKKALRSSLKKQGYNIQRKKTMKETVKEFSKLIADKKLPEAKTLIPKVYKAIDKAAKRGVIKKNTAARKKSRLMAKINKIQKA